MAMLNNQGVLKKSQHVVYMSKNHVYHAISPYGSKRLLGTIKVTPQIIPQTLPKKVLGSIGSNMI